MTKPISEIIPLAQWIRLYHSFRAQLNRLLYRTGYDLLELHHKKLGPPTHEGVWEVGECVVYVGARTITIEVPERFDLDSTLVAFDKYQEALFN